LGRNLEEAVMAPRVHASGEQVYAEPGALDALDGGAEDGLTRYEEKDAFFGGVNAVERSEDGTFKDFADPRRGGGVSNVG
jgi:gamma-glutamyltranspeptidase